MTESYYKAIQTYKTEKEDELSFREGQTIIITNKDDPEWFLAETLNRKKFGLVPRNHFEEVKNDIVLAKVIQRYKAQAPEELSLQENGVVVVLDQNVADGWWKGNLNGEEGVFPADHVQLVERNGFKLAAYGVKQGGIGSILAGGGAKRSSTMSNRTSMNEKPTVLSSNAYPSIPNKPSQTKTENIKAMVIHDYTAENEDEIKLMRGEYVTNIDKLEDDGWWKGTTESGTTGVFPSTYVQVLEEDKPPQRPTRARPATVKSENASENSLESIVRPPPVPVTTRPTSLLSSRPASQNSSASAIVASPPPRPITTPSRPITSPPIPQRQNSMVISPSSSSHKRMPSVPLVSPDLPPISPIHERQNRPIITMPIVTDPGSNPGPLSPTQSSSGMHRLAKPPKVAGNRQSTIIESVANEPIVPPRTNAPSTSFSRPSSSNDNDHNDAISPPVPKRSMPPLPQPASAVPKKDELKNITTTSTANSSSSRPPYPTHSLPSPPQHTIDDSNESLEQKIQRLVLAETESLRLEFEAKLEEERIERQKLQEELEELKSRF